jgi:hypothetical protein
VRCLWIPTGPYDFMAKLEEVAEVMVVDDLLHVRLYLIGVRIAGRRVSVG